MLSIQISYFILTFVPISSCNLVWGQMIWQTYFQVSMKKRKENKEKLEQQRSVEGKVILFETRFILLV